MHDPIPTIRFPDGAEVPALGLGTWNMGDSASRAAAEIASLKTGLDLGMTLIDTAEMYANGGAEQIVAKAIEGRRDDIFLVSKVLPSNAGYKGTIKACEDSLARLKTERLDLYLLHWRGRYPLSETVEAFEKLKADGKIAAWGVSNFDTDDMEELWSVPDGRNVATNQVLYNLSRRGIEFDLLPWCQEHNIPIMAYSPIEQGRLLHSQELIRIAKANQATPAQVALAFLLEREGVIPIPKTSNVDRVAENRESIALDLSEEDWAALDAAFPPPSKKKPLDMI